MHRTKLGFLLLSCPLLACADDIPAEPGTESTSTGDSTTGVTVNPTTVTVTDTDTESGVDETATSSGDTGTSSSGEPGTSSSGDPSTSSSGDPSTSSSSSSGGPACGDGNQDGGEECDGADLAGYNCVTLGPDFTGGTLACAADCTFDTSACVICGNDAIDGADACDGADLGGLGCADIGGGFTGGTLACDAACGYDPTACTSFPQPLAGEVIITEIMQNPAVIADLDGEWFEIHNPTMGTSFQLDGCSFEGATDLGFTIDVDMVIGPGEYRIFSTDSLLDQGFTADYHWLDAQYNLTNTSDLVRLVCNGVEVDVVSYDDGATFPDPNGQSMSLDLGSYDAVANDTGGNWCVGATTYDGGSNFGTPGADNPVCGAGPMDYTIDFCRLQFPDTIVEDQGTDVPVYGRVYIAGLTDLSGVNDPAPQVTGYVGYGPDGSDPAVDLTWTWVAGTPNAGYGPASPGYEANNDEYQATLSVPAPGSYDYAFRFSGDGGTTFTYCDGQPAGNSDGYQPANAGQMTSNAAMVASLYISEYVEGGSNNKAIEIYNPGVASANIDACVLHFYFNGSVVASTNIALAGSIAADDVLVVCDDSIIDTSFCDVLSASTFFNGDDAVELECAGTTLDVIGQIGLDPGAEWLVAGVGTQNETLRRSCSVTAGDTNGADAFDPSIEWATFPQDTFADLGQYVCP